MSTRLVMLGAEAWTVMAGAAARGAVLLFLAGIVTRLLPRVSAAQRHLIWVLACCGALLLPALQLVVPAWRLRVLPAAVAPPAATGLQVRPPGVPSLTSGAERLIGPPVSVPPRPVWFVFLVAVWGSGSLVVLYSLLRSQQRVRHLLSGTTPVSDPHVLALFADVVRATGLTHRVRLREHPTVIPMVCGVYRPTVILPHSARGWADSRLRHVLLHEAAHVKRYDGLVQTAASVVCALYWFNPLAWFAARQLRIEREQACDDAVLIAESRPSAYAMDLLALMHAFRGGVAASSAALPFAHARRSQMHTRLRAIVDTAKRRTALSRQGVVAACGALMGVVYPLAGVTLVPRKVVERPHVIAPLPVRPPVFAACQGRACTAGPQNVPSAVRKKNVVRRREPASPASVPAVPAVPTPPRPVANQSQREMMMLLSTIARLADRRYTTMRVEVKGALEVVPSATVITVVPPTGNIVQDERVLRAIELFSQAADTLLGTVEITTERYP